MSDLIKTTILQPLTLNEECSSSTQEVKFKCLFCDIEENDEKKILQHIYFEHQLIISDVHEVADLKEYLEYWKEHFKGKFIKMSTSSKIINNFFYLDQHPAEYCTTMLWKQLPDGTPIEHDEKYYLLSDIVPKDKAIRIKLKSRMIEKALARHQFERSDTNFKRGCLYCRNDIQPTTRYGLIEHLYGKHFLQLGKPENLVFIDELIDKLEEKLTNLICFYCEKIFKDRATLKEHMRKKGHKKINPENKSYDRFYMVNYKLKDEHKMPQDRKYFNPRPSFKSDNKKERIENIDDEIFENDNSEWSEWSENDKEMLITCLFCTHKNCDFNSILFHMIESHNFDFEKSTKNVNFYQKVKIVNFIRRKIHLKQCLNCSDSFESLDELLTHLSSQNHLICNEKSYDRPEFYFPTFEDDSFLCNLDNFIEEDSMSESESVPVISEDRMLTVNADAEMLSREKFLNI